MEQNARFARLLFAGGGQQLLYHQERQRGLAVAERAVHHLLYRVGKRHPQCADELILIRMRLSSVQPRCQVEVDALVAEAGGRLQHGQLTPVVGGQPSFLAQLTLGADERVFIHPIELARRNFQRQAANGDAVLADENHVPVIIQRDNARRAGVDDCITFAVADAREFDRTTDRGVIVTNPPYGERLMEKREAEALYTAFGAAYAKTEHWRLYLLSSHTEFERAFGRPADKKRKLYNGTLRCDLFQYTKDV